MTPATKQDKIAEFQYLIAVETANKQVRNALRVTVFTGSILTIFWLISTLFGQTVGQACGGLLEILFVFGMGYGISRYSVVCIRLMFGYLVVSALHQLLTNGFYTYGIYCKAYLLYYLWIGIDATQRYNRLVKQNPSSLLDLDRTIEQDRPSEDCGSSGEDNLQTTAASNQPLNPVPELLSLCGGDLAQAQWLLSKMKSKHRDRSVEWCNDRAIEQLNNSKM
jgi:hypothetical protein